jgi:recombination protein RecT
MADPKSATPATTGKPGSNLPVSAQRFNTVKSLVEKNKAALLMALPKHIDPDRFARVFYTTILKTPKLLECEPRSLVSALIQCGELGLETNPFLGLVYLLPFWNGKTKQLEVQLIPGYRGYVSLAMRSGQVVDVTAHVIYENEPCEILYGNDERINHTPLPPDKRGDKKIGAYVRTKLRDGTVKTTFMWTDDILKRREVSQGAWLKEYNQVSKKFENKLDKDGKKILDPKSSWCMWEDEQFEKTAIRHQARLLPLSPEYSRIQALDVAVESNQSQRQPIDFDDVSDIIDVTEQSALSPEAAAEEVTHDRTEALKERLDAANKSTQVV